MPCNINAIYTLLKSTFSGLQFRRWQYCSVFIRLAVIASETGEMSRNSKRIWPYSSSRSSKVIDLGVNGKPICDFLLVSNCNFSCICYRFRDIHAYDTIRYDTIEEFNVDWKAEYLHVALSSTRSQKKKLKQTTPVPL